MIFLEHPITVQHIRDVCARFNEGLRVEYKGTFDNSVRDQLPKIISSFANSQGGVLVIGVRALNGVPQAPFEGFARAPREEYPLTVENVCLRNIQPPIFPRTEVIEGDTPNQVFLVIEVEESGEAPHAIENSKKVYVRTGNAANPYDFAEVDLIIDLLKRRHEPLERRDRLLRLAEQRSQQSVRRDIPFAQVVICPAFPRSALCSPHDVWEFLRMPHFNMGLVNFDSMRRIPNGAASLTYPNNRQYISGQYVEIGNHGLLFAARHLAVIPWANGDAREQLYFRDLLQPLVRLTVSAERFYSTHGYHGNLTINVSLRHVEGRAMRFVAANPYAGDDPDEFRCCTDDISAERLATVDEIRTQRVDVLTGILAEVTWAFWQSNANHPITRLRQNVEQMMEQVGV